MEKIVAIISTLINRVNAVDSKVDEVKANVGALDTKVSGLVDGFTLWAKNDDSYHKLLDTKIAELLEAVKDTSKAIAAIKVAGQTDTINDTMSNELDKLLAEANGTEATKPAADKPAPKKTQKKADKTIDKVTKDKQAEAVIEALEAKPADTSVDDELDKLLAEASGTATDTKLEADSEDVDEDEITIEELKAQFEARSSQERRLVCQSYLKYKGHPEDARVPALLNWEHCETVGEQDEFAQYVLDYEDKMNK